MTLSLMKDYADDCNSDFLVIQNTEYVDPVYEKLRVSDFLDIYSRVLYIDADVFITPGSPNLFDIVPSDQIGVYLESEHVPERIKQTTYVWEKNKLEFEYCKFVFNAGVMLFSQAHKEKLRCPNKIEINKFMRFKEQCWFNYVMRDETPFNITHKFNHMDLSGQPETNIYFRHYAAGDRIKLLKIFKGEDNGNT